MLKNGLYNTIDILGFNTKFGEVLDNVTSPRCHHTLLLYHQYLLLLSFYPYSLFHGLLLLLRGLHNLHIKAPCPLQQAFFLHLQ